MMGIAYFACRVMGAGLLGLMSIGALGGASRAQPAGESIDKDSKIDLRIFPSTDPVLVQIKSTVKSSAEFKRPGASLKERFEMSQEVRYVDRFTTLDDEKRLYESSRTYVRDHTRSNGLIADSCLNGVVIHFRDDAGTPSLEVGEDRLLPRKIVDRLLEETAFVGPWLALPQAVAVGDRFSVKTRGLLTTVTMPDGPIEVIRSEFVLEAMDPETGLASLTGEVEWKEQLDGPAMQLAVTSRAAATLTIDTNAHRLVDLGLQGTGKVEGRADPNSTIEGEARFRSTLTTKAGPVAASALKSRPRFREAIHELKGLGVLVKLPSFWGKIETEDGSEVWIRTLPPGTARIALQKLQLDDLPVEEMMRQTEASMRSQGQDPVLARVTSPLSKGFSTRLVKEGQTIHTEFYRLGRNQTLVFQIVGAESFATAFKEYEKARRSLKAIKRN